MAFIPRRTHINEFEGKNPELIDYNYFKNPILFGIETPQNIIKRKFIEKYPKNNNFRIMALTPTN